MSRRILPRLRRRLRTGLRGLGFTAAGILLHVPTLHAAERPRPFDLETMMRGERVFSQQCVFCHGRTGRGDGEWAAGVATKPRDFTKGIFKFRSTPPGSLPTEADLARTIRTGVSGTMMPAFTKLTPLELEAVIAYVRGFSKRWEDPQAYGEPLPPAEPPKWFFDAEAGSAPVQRGAASFSQLCAPCHGPAARGDGPAGQGLRDTWGRPITPADLTAPHLKSGDEPADLFRTISLGLDGTPMVGFLPTLGPERIWELVAFLRRQTRPEAPRPAEAN